MSKKTYVVAFDMVNGISYVGKLKESSGLEMTEFIQIETPIINVYSRSEDITRHRVYEEYYIIAKNTAKLSPNVKKIRLENIVAEESFEIIDK